MNITNLLIQTSTTFAAVAAVAMVGLGIWWLVRKRQKRVWLPTVRILELESQKLPRLVVKAPPLIAFLCFLACAVAISFFTLQPKEQVFTPYEPNQTRIHMFIDLSPSVSAQVSVEELSRSLGELFPTLTGMGRLTVSTSHGPEIFEPQSAVELQALVTEKGFHRGGLRLGSAMKMVLADAGDVDQLFVVSDRDQHSWQDFNWSFLQEDMDVLLVDVTKMAAEPAGNIFIYQTTFGSQPSATTMDWTVELRRTAAGIATSGRLEVEWQGKKLSNEEFTFAEDAKTTSVRVSWQASGLGDIEAEGTEPLLWKLVLDRQDAIVADNEFRSPLRGRKLDAVVISAPTGERELEDPVHQLEMTLEVLGFRIHRVDRLGEQKPKASQYALWVVMGGGRESLESYCPSSLEDYRLAFGKDQGARATDLNPPRVWLVPKFVDSDYKSLCQCYFRLMKSESTRDPLPSYCDNVESRNHWIGLLPSVGAKQIGGEIGDVSGSLAFNGRDGNSGLEVLSFTMPLQPRLQTGLSHALLPVLVKNLLGWHGLVESDAEAVMLAWPRISDIALEMWVKRHATDDRPLDPAELKKLLASNVPTAESSLGEQEASQLPPQWNSGADLGQNQLPMKKDRDDPQNWLILIGALVALAVVLEAISRGGGLVMRTMHRRKETVLILVILGGLSFAEPSAAQIELNVVGYPEFTLRGLGREVRHRTSIELAASPVRYSSIDANALSAPWLWVRSLASITDGEGKLRQDLQSWLVRGGLMILEGNFSEESLNKMTTNLTHQSEWSGRWQPIPPDHELMRSFYLLDALPVCQSNNWSGFIYDARLSVVVIPYGFLTTLVDQDIPCQGAPNGEQATRAFVNLLMVALATDYKKDQIHLPEILKRLR